MGNLKRILIVGGGSSGWMAAAALRRRLAADIEITLIEASDVPIIGVGESTNPVSRYFQLFAGLDEKAMMRASNAAFKVAILFENFNHLGGTFTHPFGTHKGDHFRPRAEHQYPNFHLAMKRNLFTKTDSYSYQLDAGLYGQYLKQIFKKKGVKHIVDKVRGVDLDGKGEISSVQTEQSGPLTADLYIDCSGFRSIILDKTLHEPFHPVSKYLLNDRALAARVPYVDKETELRTVTTCTALSSGWVWSIPLWSRIGTGYVYSSAFKTRDAAECEYREFLGAERVKDLDFNEIHIRAGRHERAWVGNCVGIGISYGFLEPLESTGLALTQLAVIELANTLSVAGATSAQRKLFNARQAHLFDTTRDFIIAHYALTRRDDTPYWQYIRDELPLPDTLVEILEYARHSRYDPLDAFVNPYYASERWNIILSGMGFFDGRNLERVVYQPHPPAAGEFVHARYLAERIYDGEYHEPTLSDPSGAIQGHPMWDPSW